MTRIRYDFLWIYIILNFSFSLQSQTSKIIHQSNYKHDYVIGRITYLENLKDTTRHKYIATLQIYTEYHPLYINEATNLINIKIKELGANSYYLQSFEIKDSSIILRLKAYFINDSYFIINNTYKLKNNVFLFSDFFIENHFQSCYINDTLLVFNTKNYFQLNPKIGNTYHFKTCNDLGLTLKRLPLGMFTIKLSGIYNYKSKADKEADFVAIYKDKLIPADKIPDKDKIQISKCGFNTFDYNGGRMLLEIFKPFTKN
jgi:hypothetical protein